jgi:hypothetical protein
VRSLIPKAAAASACVGEECGTGAGLLPYWFDPSPPSVRVATRSASIARKEINRRVLKSPLASITLGRVLPTNDAKDHDYEHPD